VTDKLVSAEGLGVRRGGRWLVRGVNLAVHSGEIVTLIGPNGGGKSTTAKMLLGLIKPEEGRRVMAPDLSIGYMPQRFSIDWTLPLTVSRLMTLTRRHPRADVLDALQAVGCAGLLGRPVQALSGGEFQRVLLARALLRHPQLLVLDEPVQGVDFAGEIEMYDLIGRLRDERGCGVLLISHDLHVVMAQTDTVVCMDGHVCCSGPPKSVVENAEYRRLFGARAAGALAVFQHDMGHHHHHHGHDHDHKDHDHA
jgi:zinc transport system ATP-binding protein